MRRPIVTVAVAATILAAAVFAGFAIAACGDSGGSAGATQAAATMPGGGPPDMSAMITEALDPLVEQGTITADQETAVVETLSSSMPGGGPGSGGQGGGMPSPGATPPSGEVPGDGAAPAAGAPQGSMPDPGEMFSSALDALVDDGTITSAQETAIVEALGSVMQRGGPGQPGQQSGQST